MNKSDLSRSTPMIIAGLAALYLCGFLVTFIIFTVYTVKNDVGEDRSHQQFSDAMSWNFVYSIVWPATLSMMMNPDIPRE